MEKLNFKVTCKELNGDVTTSAIELNENNEFLFDTTRIVPGGGRCFY